MARISRYSSRYKPVGWRNEPHRHYLAAKGISTIARKRYFYAPLRPDIPSRVDRSTSGNRGFPVLKSYQAKGYSNEEAAQLDPEARIEFSRLQEMKQMKRSRALSRPAFRPEQFSGEQVGVEQVEPVEGYVEPQVEGVEAEVAEELPGAAPAESMLRNFGVQ